MIKARQSLKNSLSSGSYILDQWKVKCKAKCCETKLYEDLIYHASSGEIVVEKNGALDAINSWNKRK